jgi:hypothetical protein
MKNNGVWVYIKEKTAMVGSGHSKIGFYWSLLRIGLVSSGLSDRFFQIIGSIFSDYRIGFFRLSDRFCRRIGYIKSIKRRSQKVAREHSILS